MKRTLGVVVVVAVAVAWWWLRGLAGERGLDPVRDDVHAEERPPSGAEGADVRADAGEPAARRAVETEVSVGEPAAAELDVDALIRALEEVGEISLGAREGDLNARLVPLVTGVSQERWDAYLAGELPVGLDTARAWRVLDLLGNDRLYERRFAPGGADPLEAEPSTAEIGAYQVVLMSLVNYTSDGLPGINGFGEIVDGPEFARELVRTLPAVRTSGEFLIPNARGEFTPDFRTWFYRSLGSAWRPDEDNPGRREYLLNDYYAEILLLRGLLTDREIELLTANLDPRSPEERVLDALALLRRRPLDEELAAEVAAELLELIHSHPGSVDLAGAMPELKQLFHEAEDFQLRGTLTQIVALRDEVGPAAIFLAETGGAETIGAFLALGERPGGGAAIFDTYRELMLANDQTDQRLAMLMGMGDGDHDKIRYIVENDPDPKVRGQGFLTLSSAPGWSPSPEDLSSFFAHADVPTRLRVMTAGNYLRRGGEQPELIDYLAGVAGGSGYGARERAAAAKTLGGYLAPEEVEALLAQD